MSYKGPSNLVSFCYCVRHPGKSLPYLVCCILIVLALLTFLIHYYISNFYVVLDGENRNRDVDGHFRNPLEEMHYLKLAEVKQQIEDLKRIRMSVNEELVDLERRRQSVLMEIGSSQLAIEALRLDHNIAQQQLDNIRLNLRSVEVELDDLRKDNRPLLQLPYQLDSLPLLSNKTKITKRVENECNFDICINYTRCSLAFGFTTKFVLMKTYLPDLKVVQAFYDLIKTKNLNSDTGNPCIFIIIYDSSSIIDPSLFNMNLLNISSWKNLNGTNHILWDINSNSQIVRHFTPKIFNSIHATSRYNMDLRSHFDIFMPPFSYVFNQNINVYSKLSMLVPAHRKHLISFEGKHVVFMNNYTDLNTFTTNDVQKNELEYYLEVKRLLLDISVNYPLDRIYLSFNCEEEIATSKKKLPIDMNINIKSDDMVFDVIDSGWVLCGSELSREIILKKSTFVLILCGIDGIFGYYELLRLLEAMSSGSIPVVLGSTILRLPLEELIDWTGAIFKWPMARLPELHFVLRSINDGDILEMRRIGRLIIVEHLASLETLVDSLMINLRQRLNFPPPEIYDYKSISVFNTTFLPETEDIISPLSLEGDEPLGPIEPPFKSTFFQNNYTQFLNKYKFKFLFPSTPFDPTMPSDAKFIGSSYGFRPIKNVGIGKEFWETLGGNNPREQFTVVILTYDREAILMTALARLKGLPHLHSIVVVWNYENPPSLDLKWPEIGVKINVIKMEKNSLNNRFLPFDVIETDAVLSLDDDVHLRHDEIIFAFRVWRESRERIVGFPGRFTSWAGAQQESENGSENIDNNWLYNSNYSCELSMVLTGAAFIHKYYLYVYTHIMPSVIRDKVDEFLNCEDLAMNFLISHITRKPPIKVTSRWTFRCPGCENALYVEETHFEERHKCINFFTRIYGYLPLMNTQFRADSILFKTRIPHDKKKCFRFI